MDAGTPRVSPSAVLEPARDGTDHWTITDHGNLELRAPLAAIRVSVLWKADVYRTALERDTRHRNALSMHDVADIFNSDLASRGTSLRFDLARIDELSLKSELAAVYPEAVPVGAHRSVFDPR